MNPTVSNPHTIDETRQGEAYFVPDIEHISTDNVKRFYIESYGCQMNFSDSEIVASILADCQYKPTGDIEKANLILAQYMLYPGKS